MATTTRSGSHVVVVEGVQLLDRYVGQRGVFAEYGAAERLAAIKYALM